VRKRAVFPVPFDRHGGVLHYACGDEYWAEGKHQRIIWGTNEPALMTLWLDGMETGRSAKYLVFKNIDGATFPVFVKDLIAMVRHPDWREGALTAKFEPCKRGSNYGIRLAT
jgi:hypothetical protein